MDTDADGVTAHVEVVGPLDPGEVRAVAALRNGLPSLEAVELVLAEGVALVASTLGLDPPDALRAPAALIVEVAAASDPLDELAAVVSELDLVGSPAVATTADQRQPGPPLVEDRHVLLPHRPHPRDRVVP